MKAPEPLSEDLRDLLDAERDIDPPSPAERERMSARILPLILPIAPVDAPATELGAAATASGGVGAKLVIVSMISAAIGAGGGAAGHAYYASKHPPVLAAPVAVVPSVSVAIAPSEPEPPPVVESAAPASSAAPAALASAKPASSLRSERLLLETASAALMKGDSASAIAALKQHAQRFPKGELAQEREVLLVQALAASGDGKAAERRAQDFKKKFPGSLQQDSVDKASKPK